MTRVCMDCEAELGEKCSRCSDGGQVFPWEGQLRCIKCGLIFTRGQGGETHGLCETCKSRRLAALAIPAAKDARCA